MRGGLSYESFAATVGVCSRTLYNWEKDHEPWVDAKGKAFAASLLWWESQGIAGVWNESSRDSEGAGHTRALNSAVWIFNMKNRFKWKDRQPEEIADEARAALKLAYRLDDEAKK